MAIYKIFPSADSTIYSSAPIKNTGLDEILEVSVKNNGISQDDIRRALIKFSDSDLEIINNLKSEYSWQANLKLYLANAEGLSIPYTLEFNQITDDWLMGTGKFLDSPQTTNGVSWYSTGSYIGGSNTWSNPSYYITPGGGSWSNGVVQSFDYKDDKDINADITQIVQNWFNGDNNYGIIIKHETAIENNQDSFITLSYFSVDTHTIFPPCLEIRWDDSTYNNGDLAIIDNSNTIITIANNPYKIKANDGKYQFRVSARDKYPVRTFSTASIYTVNKALPETSYWSIQDVKTEDIIFDFDEDYTKISCDEQGSFINIFTNGLELERYYKILIKIVLDSGESYIVDNNNIFKIIR
jgi:hypothetical protein